MLGKEGAVAHERLDSSVQRAWGKWGKWGKEGKAWTAWTVRDSRLAPVSPTSGHGDERLLFVIVNVIVIE